MQDYKKLRVWHEANALVLTIYSATQSFPDAERFGLTAQIRRASVSIAANIAEGCGRGTRADTARFFQIALGSASEVACYLEITRGLGLLAHEALDALEAQLTVVRRMLIRLLLRLKAHIRASRPRHP